MKYFDANDVAQNKAMGILAYIGFLCLVPIFAAKNSPYARYHANQGLLLFIINIAASVVSFIFGLIPWVGWIISLIISLVFGIITLVFMILGIMNACSGQVKGLPLLEKITILQ